MEGLAWFPRPSDAYTSEGLGNQASGRLFYIKSVSLAILDDIGTRVLLAQGIMSENREMRDYVLA